MDNSEDPPSIGSSYTLISDKEGERAYYENRAHATSINGNHSSLSTGKLYKEGYPSEYHLRAKMEELISTLRSCYWHRNQETARDPLIHIKTGIDYGDSITSLGIRTIQLKFRMVAARMEMIKEVLLKNTYGDSYNSGLRTYNEYIVIRD